MTRSTRISVTVTFTAAFLLGLAACSGTQPPSASAAGQATSNTAYRSAGETLFLEVGPELKPCSHGVMQGAQCMQVREVQVNAAGVRTSAGEFGNFDGTIDGFAHEAGVRNVLRVKRYARENVPADASRFVYELETRVETERVGTR